MSIELKYWDGRGLMEVPRVLLALAGKFPGEGAYTDGRFYREGQTPSANAKPYSEADGLDANLGRMPILNVDGTGVGQSVAINYYLAAKFGFMGNNELEGAQILAISEHIKEMNVAFAKVVPPYTEPTDEQLDTWYNTGAEDVKGTADMMKRPERQLKWWAGRIEANVGEGGFAVGSKLSLADVLLYNVFMETLKEEECQPGVPAFRKGPFAGSTTRMEAALANYPKIKACCENVQKQPNMQKWLSTRGKQNS